MYGQTECTRVSYLPPEQFDRAPDVGRPRHAQPGDVHRRRGGPPRRAGRGRRTGRPRLARDEGLLGNARGHPRKAPPRPARRRAGALSPATCSAPTRRAISTSSAARTTSSRAAARRSAPRKSRTCSTAIPTWPRRPWSACPTRSSARRSRRSSRSSPASNVTERELLRHCADHLEDFMVPQTIEFRDSLPKTDNGKIDKRALQGVLT